jgi:hypothetical protein
MSEAAEEQVQAAYASAYRLGGRQALYEALCALRAWARPCPACNGRGHRAVNQRGESVRTVPCDACSGHGRISPTTARAWLEGFEHAEEQEAMLDQLWGRPPRP